VKPFPTMAVNLLLEAMPTEDRKKLSAAGEQVELARGTVVFRGDGGVPHVYFPLGGMLSVVTRMQDGSTVEALTVGKEGATGPPLIAEKGLASNVECVCQLPGPAMRVPTEVFFDLRRRSETFDALLDQYGQAVFAQIAQTAACNRLHPIEARTSRWLLQAHDRMGGSYLPLTQEFLAEMLGVRRETVNLSARLLQNAGLIDYHRGEIEILDRAGLESTCCECYGVIRRELERLFPFL
jgi:CRP-like cAMP-binding protein